MSSILEVFNKWVQLQPNKTLYAFLDIDGLIKEKYSYQEFSDRINIISGQLKNRYKFKRNDKILLAFPPGLENICAFFACVKNGLIPVPTFPPASSGFQSSFYKMVFIASDCDAAAVLTSEEYYWNLKLNMAKNNVGNKNILSHIPWINTGELSAVANNLTSDFETADFLFLQYTSGSTNRPKGVMVSHENLLHNADLSVDHLPVGVTWLPQYHDMGLIGYYLFFAIKGGTTYGFSSLDFIKKPSLWLETITKYEGTASSAPNFAYDYCTMPGKISDEKLQGINLSSLRYLMTAAEPVNYKTFNKFIDFFKPYGLNPNSHFAAYGLAENTLAVSNYGRKNVSIATESLKRNILHVLAPNSNLIGSQIMSCGIPLGDQKVKIVDPTTHIDLGEEAIGEIWVSGKSKCLGYWNKSKLNKEVFEARIVNASNSDNERYLRTGDLGFLYEKELYVCGRLKDLIIIRGMNYYPQDIEKIVEDGNPGIREGHVAAFSVEEEMEEKLIIVAGLKNVKNVPDPMRIIEQIRKNLNIQVANISFINSKFIPKTSSGKIMRSEIKQMWLDNQFEIVEKFNFRGEPNSAELSSRSPFNEIKVKYGLTGQEEYSLVHILDSLDLICLIHDVKELLVKRGAANLSLQIDNRLIQEINVSEFFNLVEELQESSFSAINKLRNIINKLKKEHRKFEQELMLNDCGIDPIPDILTDHLIFEKSGNILLTGGTGFLGPFLLKSLLEQTNDRIYILIRSENKEKGMLRIIDSLIKAGIYQSIDQNEFKKRVEPVCGDLGAKNFGLDKETWSFLTTLIDTVYHNGAMVNYLYNYERMREINVLGTVEIIRFSLEGKPKILNHISTTFVFGWAVEDVLYEKDFCHSLDLLDFGYSQTKYVSEQLVKRALQKGLKGRIFRPALITPSLNGDGNNFDISIRLIAFLINHQIEVNTKNQVSFTPVDIVANNIVAISNLEDSIQKTFHVTRDDYSNMMDITGIIKRIYGITMQEFNLKQFVPEVVSRCKKEDLLFPLLDFLVRSLDNISSMEFKMYNNDNYKEAKSKSNHCIADPSLEDTIKGMLLFLSKKEIIHMEMKGI